MQKLIVVIFATMWIGSVFQIALGKDNFICGFGIFILGVSTSILIGAYFKVINTPRNANHRIPKKAHRKYPV
jgi:ABC-type uncharacterized transport system permease subunit